MHDTIRCGRPDPICVSDVDGSVFANRKTADLPELRVNGEAIVTAGRNKAWIASWATVAVSGDRGDCPRRIDPAHAAVAEVTDVEAAVGTERKTAWIAESCLLGWS